MPDLVALIMNLLLPVRWMLWVLVVVRNAYKLNLKTWDMESQAVPVILLINSYYLVELLLLLSKLVPDIKLMQSCCWHSCQLLTVEAWYQLSLIDHQQFAADLATEMSTRSHKDHTDVNELLADFNSSCEEVLDSHAPSTTMSSTIKHRPGWFDDSINDAIRDQRRSERKWRKSKDIAHLEKFNASKQRVKDVVTNSKAVLRTDSLMFLVLKTCTKWLGNC